MNLKPRLEDDILTMFPLYPPDLCPAPGVTPAAGVRTAGPHPLLPRRLSATPPTGAARGGHVPQSGHLYHAGTQGGCVCGVVCGVL